MQGFKAPGSGRKLKHMRHELLKTDPLVFLLLLRLLSLLLLIIILLVLLLLSFILLCDRAPLLGAAGDGRGGREDAEELRRPGPTNNSNSNVIN